MAAANRSSSTTTESDKVANPMLKHIPRFGTDFRVHVFKLFLSLYSFPSIWKTSSIIFIHKMRRAFFPPTSHTFCISMLFERIILLYFVFSFFLDSNFILSHCPGGSALNRLPLITCGSCHTTFRMGLVNTELCSWTILATIDFSKASDVFWHPALFHKLISAGFPVFHSLLSDKRPCENF